MNWKWLSILFLIVIAFSARRYFIDEDRESRLIHLSAKPGPLSIKHASLENNCESCHTPYHGVEALNCVGCHAGETSLLKRQPTAFHANIQECAGCHIEHRGVSVRPVIMDHQYFTHLSLKTLERSAKRNGTHELTDYLQRISSSFSGNASPRAQDVLKCSSCHSNDDKHFKLFGQSCGDCHPTETWKISRFRHPSPASTDCSQCHQAPPSHYMMHFQMVSERVAHVEHANVNQCFLCHQTTSWNDIKGIGWYKHH